MSKLSIRGTNKVYEVQSEFSFCEKRGRLVGMNRARRYTASIEEGAQRSARNRELQLEALKKVRL